MELGLGPCAYKNKMYKLSFSNQKRLNHLLFPLLEIFVSLTTTFNNYSFQKILINMHNKMHKFKGYVSVMKNA